MTEENNVVEFVQPEKKLGRASANDVDKAIGIRLRERRKLMGLTQQQAAELINVTYQQWHKYEKGINRIASSRLYQIAQVLGTPITYFFEDFESPEASQTVGSREFINLSNHFAAITSEEGRRTITELARNLAAVYAIDDEEEFGE